MTTAPITDEDRIDCAAANATLDPLSALDRIRWAVDALGDGVVLLSSMQKTAVVLMHLFHRLDLSNEVLFVDTGYHFFETLKMRDEYMRRVDDTRFLYDQELRFGTFENVWKETEQSRR